MKLIISVVFLTACVAVTVSTFCKSEDDCKEGKCCVALSALQMAGKGLCIKLNRKKAKCNAPDAKMDYYGGKYLIYCPCEEGLECDTGGAKGFGRCKVSESSTTSEVVTDEETFPDVTQEETSPPEEVTEPEVVDEVTEEETLEPEVVDEVTEEETLVPEVVDEVTEEETSPPEEVTEPEVVDEVTEEIVDDEADSEETEPPQPETEGDVEEPEEIGQGPGGEPPRDDDCADWELPC